MYDVTFFIRKFEAIPEDKWCVGVQEDEHGRRCAAGHCFHANAKRDYLGNLRATYGDDPMNIFYALQNVIGCYVAELNNGKNKEYRQPTPKQRVLARLYDIRDKELSEANVNAAKEIIEVEKIENVLV